METQSNLLESAARVQRALNDAGIESIVIGGLAVAIWGEPRVTRDVDLKVLLQRDRAEALLSALPEGFRSLADQPEDTLRRVSGSWRTRSGRAWSRSGDKGFGSVGASGSRR